MALFDQILHQWAGPSLARRIIARGPTLAIATPRADTTVISVRYEYDDYDRGRSPSSDAVLPRGDT